MITRKITAYYAPMIVIFYNSNKNIYYAKYLKNAYLHSHYEVGYINQYNHKVVCMFYFNGGKLVNCKSFADYISYFRYNSTFKKRILTKLIKLLENIKCSLERRV